MQARRPIDLERHARTRAHNGTLLNVKGIDRGEVPRLGRQSARS